MAALSTVALLALAGAKTALDYKGQRDAAKQQEQKGDFEAGLFRQNATLADAQAEDAVSRGNQSALQVERGARALSGAQRASLAAQGIRIDGGSATDVVASDRALSTQDELTLRNNAQREAWGFQQQASSYRMQADFAQAAGHNAARGLRRQAVGTLLGGAAELADIWSASPKGVGSAPTGSGGYTPVPKGTPSYSGGIERAAKGRGPRRSY
jgi:hypothetical protein